MSSYENDDDEDGGGGEELPIEGENERPSSYALGTSMRSMKSLSRKKRMPMIGDNKRRKRKLLNWLKSFHRLDPRWQICNFFDDLAYDGVGGIDETGRIQSSSFHLSFIIRAFSRVGVFIMTVR